jgi:hypothetical protein
MRKQEFAIQVLTRIREIAEVKTKLLELGVDFHHYEMGVDLLEESIALLYSKNETGQDEILDLVQWWLYENVERKIKMPDGSFVKVETPKEFIDWLEWYESV